MGLLTALLLVSAAAAQEQPTTLALPELRTFNLDPKLESFFAEHLAAQLKLQGLRVVTKLELQTLLGIERQKQLLGCAENQGSCMAELADALGADGVVVGDVARIGSTFQVNLKVIAGNDGRTLAVFSEAASSEEAMLQVLTKAALELAEPTFRNLGRAPPANLSVVSPPPNLRRVAWAPLGLGALLIAGGTAGLVFAGGSAAELRSGKPLTDSDGAGVVNRGKTQETLGIAGISIGAAAVAVGAVFLAFGPKSPVTITPSAGAGSAGLVLRAELP